MKKPQHYLRRRETCCAEISALYALGRRKEAVVLLRKLLKAKSIGRKLASELFFHLSLLLGFPNALDGLERLALLQVAPAKSSRRISQTKQLQKQGLVILRRVYGDQSVRLLRSLKGIHPDLPTMIVESVYGQVIGRSGMSLRQRELVNVTVLTIQRLDRQLYSHLRGSLRVGVRPEALRSLFTLLQTRFLIRVDTARRFLKELEHTDR
ncbi:MAG: carboxymuconolactone decarboxylase family protein [Bacteroidota bacterium]